MSVYRRSDNQKWMVEFTFQHPDGRKEVIRKVSPVQTRRGAEQYEHQLRQALLDGHYRKQTPSEVPTFVAFAQEFIENYAVVNNKPSTVRGKRKELRHHLIPFFGRYRLDKIGLKEVEQYKRKKVSEELSPKTINNTLTTFHKLLDVAREWELVETIPRIKWLKVPPQHFDFLNFEEAECLVNAASGVWKAMILIALKTGMRQGELLELRWSDINFEAKTILVSRSVHRGYIGSPKNGRSRDIPLCDSALETLKAHYHSRSELVFCTRMGGQLTDSLCRRPLYNACKQADVRRIGWHVLRHTFASHLVMEGVSIKVVQELMGHSTLTMTMRYAHLCTEVKREAVQVLNRHRTHIAQPELKIVTA